jgi:hypothetical protein
MAKLLLYQYFNDLAKLLTASAQLGGVTGSSVDAGKNREILVVSTLKQHLPNRAQVIQGGIIIDSKNKFSGQIDVTICNSFSFLGGALEYGIIPVEAIIAAIEVKSMIKNESLRDVFVQLDRVKQLKKKIADSDYDAPGNLLYRIKRALVIGWFWKGNTKIKTASEWLCNPKGHIAKAGFGGNRPNAIYVHDKYLLICDPRPLKTPKKGAGLPNPFLIKFRKIDGVLRNKEYLGKARTPRDIYHFEKPDFQPIEVLLMWLSHEINRYIKEIPDVAAYVSYKGNL